MQKYMLKKYISLPYISFVLSLLTIIITPAIALDDLEQQAGPVEIETPSLEKETQYTKAHQVKINEKWFMLLIFEGSLEPPQAGSYTINLYDGSISNFHTDKFITGIVQKRKGTLEKVLFVDTNDTSSTIIVVTEYTEASDTGEQTNLYTIDVFKFTIPQSLSLIASQTNVSYEALQDKTTVIKLIKNL